MGDFQIYVIFIESRVDQGHMAYTTQNVPPAEMMRQNDFHNKRMKKFISIIKNYFRCFETIVTITTRIRLRLV